MRIWTTPLLNSLLSITELPVRLFSGGTLKKNFFDYADPGDMIILDFDDRYLEFLAAVKDRGMTGPVIFISPEPIMLEADLARYHALVLDLKKTGDAAVKAAVHFLATLAARCRASAGPAFSPDGSLPNRKEERPVEDEASIRQRLAHIERRDIPVIVALEVRENGEPVTARGACSLKTIGAESIVLHRFRQSLLFHHIRQGMTLSLYFPYRQKNHGAVVSVASVADREIEATFPARLFLTREMRIQPGQQKPVTLFALIPGEPTTALRVTDISPRGIGFLCSRDLPADGVFPFTILLPDPEAIVQTTGVIRFKRESAGGIRYGAEINPHPWDEESIAQYVMKRETEIIRLLRSSS